MPPLEIRARWRLWSLGRRFALTRTPPVRVLPDFREWLDKRCATWHPGARPVAAEDNASWRARLRHGFDLVRWQLAALRWRAMLAVRWLVERVLEPVDWTAEQLSVTTRRALQTNDERTRFHEALERWAIARAGGAARAATKGAIAVYEPIVSHWPRIAAAFGIDESVDRQTLDWLWKRLTGDGREDLAPDALRVLFDLSPGPSDHYRGDDWPEIDTLLDAPAGYARMRDRASSTLRQLAAWLLAKDGPRGVYVLAGVRGSGKSAFVQRLQGPELRAAECFASESYWPLVCGVSIGSGTARVADVLHEILLGMVRTARARYREALGSFACAGALLLALNDAVLQFGNYAHRNRVWHAALLGVALVVLALVGFFTAPDAAVAAWETLPALIVLPTRLTEDLSVFAVTLTIALALGLMLLGWAYDRMNGGPKRPWAQRWHHAAWFLLCVLPAVGFLGKGPDAAEPGSGSNAAMPSLLYATLGLFAILVLDRLASRWVRKPPGQTRDGSALPAELPPAQPIHRRGLRFARLEWIRDEFIAAAFGLTALAVLITVPGSKLHSASFALFPQDGPWVGFAYVMALFAILALWLLLLPPVRFRLNYIRALATQIIDRTPDAPAAAAMPAHPLGDYVKAILPRFRDHDLPDDPESRAQQGLLRVMDEIQAVFGRVVVWVDDVDILPSSKYPEILRALRPLTKACEGVVAVIAVPMSFYHAYKLKPSNDVHSSVRDAILLGPAALFQTAAEAVAAADRQADRPLQVFAPGSIRIGGQRVTLPSQVAVRTRPRADPVTQGVFALELLYAAARLPLTPGVLAADAGGTALGRWLRERDPTLFDAQTQFQRVDALGFSIREWKRHLEQCIKKASATDDPMVVSGSKDRFVEIGRLAQTPLESYRCLFDTLRFEAMSEAALDYTALGPSIKKPQAPQ